jgi:predicted NUDIX family phosphoesterase
VGAREDVLVVPRDTLFGGSEWTGFQSTQLSELLARVRANYRFRPRREVEEDPSEPQIIPYVVFRHGDRYFLTHRLRRSSERRLRHLYSLGVGGHINPEDVADAADPVEAGMRRELEEEVHVPAGWQVRPVGALNDDQEAVGSVHFGLVYVADLPSAEVRVRETAKLVGTFATLQEIHDVYASLETWSQFIVDAIDRRAF